MMKREKLTVNIVKNAQTYEKQTNQEEWLKWKVRVLYVRQTI